MRLVLLLLLQGSLLIASACDYCGGSSLGLESGLLTGNNGHSIGIRSALRQYKLHTNELSSTNWLSSLNISGTYSPHPRVQLQSILTAYFQSDTRTKLKQTGLGDMVVLINVRALELSNGEEKELNHYLTATVGLELPTGKYRDSGSEISSRIPMGSGSWDFLSGLNYSFKTNDYILSAGMLAKINSTNRDGMRFGHALETTIQNGYGFQVREAILQPVIGWKVNWQAKDVKNGFYRNASGGTVWWQITAIQFNYYKYRLTYQLELPLLQRLNSSEAKNGVYNSIQFTYQF